MKTIDHSRGTGVPSALLKALAACTLAVSVAACEGLDEKPSHSAGWTLLEPTQRHPILVQQQPHSMSLRVARGQTGLAPSQRSGQKNNIQCQNGWPPTASVYVAHRR